MSYDTEVAERVRRLLSSRGDVVEKQMVGGLSFLVNGNMCCGVTGMALMVRTGAESRSKLSASRTRSRCCSPAGLCSASSALIQQAMRLMTRLPAGCSGGSTSPPGSRLSLFARAVGAQALVGQAHQPEPGTPPGKNCGSIIALPAA